MRKQILSILILFTVTFCNAQVEKEIFEFEFEGVRLNGVINLPENTKPKGIVLIVHGSGQTNAVAQNWYADVRESILKAGYGTYMWDKMGCGKSEGIFNYNQSVDNSALEVIAAINDLQKEQIAGSDKIGLWGISRASWIIPIVIHQHKHIEFWISISGVDDKENFNYLFKENLRINGIPSDSIRILVQELKEGSRLCHKGESFATYMNATQNLRNNKFLKRFNNNTSITKESYYEYQKTFMQEKLDEETGLQIYVANFESILSNIDIPVLALFGEKDFNVDWEKTKFLYERTLAINSDLTIKSFPDCNHNLFQCKTGGFYEFLQDNDLPWTRCDGVLNTMTDWLNRRE